MQSKKIFNLILSIFMCLSAIPNLAIVNAEDAQDIHERGWWVAENPDNLSYEEWAEVNNIPTEAEVEAEIEQAMKALTREAEEYNLTHPKKLSNGISLKSVPRATTGNLDVEFVFGGGGILNSYGSFIPDDNKYVNGVYTEYKAGVGGWMMVDGSSPIVCGNVGAHTPWHDIFDNPNVSGGTKKSFSLSAIGTVSEETDAGIKKLLYYGWKGPGQLPDFATNDDWNHYAYDNVAIGQTYTSGSGRVYNGIYSHEAAYANRANFNAAIITNCAVSIYRHNNYGEYHNNNATAARGVSAYMTKVASLPAAPENFKVYRLDSLNDGYQDLFWFETSKDVKLSLQKSISECAELVAIAPDYYSLANAEYTLYTDANCTTIAKDKGGNNIVFKTNADGSTNVVTLEGDKTYYLKETVAPKGYLKDNNIHTIEMGASDKVFPVSDRPVFDPINVLLTKNNVNGQAVNGAQFTMRYYNSGTATGNPTRTWVFETGKGGSNGQFRYRDADKVSGDALFIDNHGDAVLLPGKYVIEETLVPTGYSKAENVIIDVSIDDNGSPVVKYSQGSSNVTNPGDAYVLNEVAPGKLRLKKTSADSSFNQSLKDAIYYVYTDANCQNRAKLFNEITKVADGAFAELKTDANGDSNIITLLPGTYYVKEYSSAAHYQINNEVITAVVQDGKLTNAEYTLVNSSETPDRGTLTVKKSSSIDNYGKSFVGTQYTLFTKFVAKDSAENVIAKDIHGNNVIFTFKADGTANETYTLNYGSYKLAETAVAPGYDWDTEVSHNVEITTNGQEVKVDAVNVPSNGYLSVKKVIHNDADKAYVEKYGYPNIEFKVYENAECTTLAKAIDANGRLVDAVLRIDENGSSNVLELKKGTYFVKEVNSGVEYEVNSSVVEAVVAPSETKEAVFENKSNLTEVDLTKAIGREVDLVTLAPDYYQLEGIQFTIYKDAGLTQIAQVYNPAEHDLSGGDAILTVKADGSSNVITLPNGEYWVKETHNNVGFYENTEVKHFTINQDAVEGVQSYTIEYENVPKTNPIDILVDKQNDEEVAVKGAIFKVQYFAEMLPTVDDVANETAVRTWYLKTDNKGFAKFDENHLASSWTDSFTDEVHDLTSDELFKRDNGTYCLLPGTYYFEEIFAPEGYAISLPFIYNMRIEAMSANETENVYNVPVIVDDYQTITLQLQKVDKETGEIVPQGYGSFEGAEFKLEYQNPMRNRWEVVDTLTTNSNGFVEKAGLRPGSYRITEVKAPRGYVLLNEPVIAEYDIKAINTAIFSYVQNIEEAPTTVEIKKTTFNELGVTYQIAGAELALLDKDNVELEHWISTTEPHVIKGLTVGEEYTIVEKNPAPGYLPLDGDVKFVVEDTEEVQSKEVVNEPIPEIHTTALFENGSKLHLNEKTKVVDTVEIKGLRNDRKYRVEAQLIDLESNTPVAEAVKEFKADAYKMDVKVDFDIDATELEGHSLVVIEKLYRQLKNGEWQEIADHSELTDKEQTVYVPKARTQAIDKADNDNLLYNEGEQIIVDTIKYEKLIKGATYKAITTLMDGETGKELLVNGEKIVVETEFVAEDADGEVKVEIKVDGKLLEGKKIVIFEDILEEDTVIALHHDITDDKQTVYVPEIKTQANLASNDVIDDLKIKITDTVSYKNLEIGRTYQMVGKLVDKATGEVLKDELGKEIVAKKLFKPEAAEGTVEVEFEIDAKLVAGHTYVAFEECFNDEKSVAIHADIEDEKQTVIIPSIKTMAKFENGTKLSVPEKTKVIDTVELHNLEVGAKYIVEGELRLEDEIVAEAAKEFKATATDMEVEVVFDVDATVLANKDLVVFEGLRKGEHLIASHAELTDEKQTVHVTDLHTTAVDKADEDKLLYNDGEQVIVDKVEYFNLIVGKEYIVKGILMDKETGKELLDAEGNNIVAEKKFTAEAEDGSVELEFVVDGKFLEGKKIVVFEDCYLDEVLVAVHADIEDEAQTVYVPEIKTTASRTFISEKDEVKKIAITDIVKYKNLVIGKEYKAVGVLMDAETGEKLMVNDAPVEAELVFKPETADGEIEIKFPEIDVPKHKVVVFEEVFENEKSIAIHNDLEDKDQTIEIPELHTNANKKDSILNTITKTVKVVDTVSYKGLIPGKEYVVKGILMNKDTNKPLLDIDGKEIVAEKKFKATDSEGTVDVVFTAKINHEKDWHVVVFENLYEGENEMLIAVHRDINDKDQYVEFPVPTGDETNIMMYAGIGGTSLTTAGGLIYLFIKKKKEEE